MPLLLTGAVLTYWMTRVGVDLTTIGIFALVGMPYAFKFVWAPLVDQLPLPLLDRWLGRRRSWMLFAQIGIFLWVVPRLSDPVETPWRPRRRVRHRLLLGARTSPVAAYRIETCAPRQGCGLGQHAARLSHRTWRRAMACAAECDAVAVRFTLSAFYRGRARPTSMPRAQGSAARSVAPSGVAQRSRRAALRRVPRLSRWVVILLLRAVQVRRCFGVSMSRRSSTNGLLRTEIFASPRVGRPRRSGLTHGRVVVALRPVQGTADRRHPSCHHHPGSPGRRRPARLPGADHAIARQLHRRAGLDRLRGLPLQSCTTGIAVTQSALLSRDGVLPPPMSSARLARGTQGGRVLDATTCSRVPAFSCALAVGMVERNPPSGRRRGINRRRRCHPAPGEPPSRAWRGLPAKMGSPGLAPDATEREGRCVNVSVTPSGALALGKQERPSLRRDDSGGITRRGARAVAGGAHGADQIGLFLAVRRDAQRRCSRRRARLDIDVLPHTAS